MNDLHKIPHCWVRRFDAKPPSSSVHTFSRPPVLEAISLIPVALRVGSYISNERANGREPIFDLNGIGMEPPNPGPHAGVPLGGLGGGAIGRGFKGQFNRWSLKPGRYIHRNIHADVFSLRVKRNGEIFSKVLSVFKPEASSSLVNWDWSLDPHCATYHALHPRSWTVYENPVPGIRVIIRQVSPFIPHNYTDSSLPVGVFVIDVENLDTLHPAEVSLMFTFQNGYDSKEDKFGGYAHSAFEMSSSSSDRSDEQNNYCETVKGVCLAHHSVIRTNTANTHESDVIDVDQGSYSIAASSNEGIITTCSQFITGHTPVSSFYMGLCTSKVNDVVLPLPGQEGDSHYLNPTDMSKGAENLWNQFVDSGEISDDPQSWHRLSRVGTKVGAAVCIKKILAPAGTIGCNKDFTFSLAWDNPIVRFTGALHNGLRRFYTRFFGTTGLASPFIAAYGLIKVAEWEAAISLWQQETLNRTCPYGAPSIDSRDDGNIPHRGEKSIAVESQTELDSPLSMSDCSEKLLSPGTHNSIPGTESAPHHHVHHENSYYSHQLFNELYFLVDGGTVWTDSTRGLNNSKSVSRFPFEEESAGIVKSDDIEVVEEDGIDNDHVKQVKHESISSLLKGSSGLLDDQTLSQPLAPENRSINKQGHHFTAGVTVGTLDRLLSQLSITKLHEISQLMMECNSGVQSCAGESSVVGQFLYVEGHEYLMYNTYDVHFYSSFSLLMLWTQLELSLQRDIAAAVPLEDLTERRMMGEGNMRPRKVKGIVPHDLGSPSEAPWSAVNVYNFQDVSRWKDLGPKFVLQIYRDYRFLKDTWCVSDHLLDSHIETFLRQMCPALLTVMEYTRQFDLDGDGMIENSGFPDQTYDIWTATGVHAYCGGLWVTACEAMSTIGHLLGDNSIESTWASQASKARKVYVDKLWNGQYLQYDSSTSPHHDSVMADMLAGQWYAHACNLPLVVTPQMALSCFRNIYRLNVIQFGGGQFIGAVNGMTPAGRVDNTCLQSREVWTGTTYALAAGMLHEAFYSSHDETELSLTKEERRELKVMSHNTARGIHDGGWERFGYHFATPEGYERNGNYRSLGYMRPLSIWAIQYAKERTRNARNGLGLLRVKHHE